MTQHLSPSFRHTPIRIITATLLSITNGHIRQEEETPYQPPTQSPTQTVRHPDAGRPCSGIDEVMIHPPAPESTSRNNMKRDDILMTLRQNEGRQLGRRLYTDLRKHRYLRLMSHNYRHAITTIAGQDYHRGRPTMALTCATLLHLNLQIPIFPTHGSETEIGKGTGMAMMLHQADSASGTAGEAKSILETERGIAETAATRDAQGVTIE